VDTAGKGGGTSTIWAACVHIRSRPPCRPNALSLEAAAGAAASVQRCIALHCGDQTARALAALAVRQAVLSGHAQRRSEGHQACDSGGTSGSATTADVERVWPHSIAVVGGVGCNSTVAAVLQAVAQTYDGERRG